MAHKSELQGNNGGFTQSHHSLESNVSAVCHKETHTHTQTEKEKGRERDRERHRDSTIGVSKCQRSMWIVVVITVKAGHPRDARLTLLTCLYQHTWTASLAVQQFSHDASQNKVLCSHTLHRPKTSSTHNAYLYPHGKRKKHAVLMKSKDPWIQVKALISYWFHLLNPLSAWRKGDQKKK